ncbi:acyl-CoA dehydrogenase family protein [Niabella ginsengisoli]|uniref:Acyl-CoA dehydrogenase/oxidase N-terminal domain-containing protein n=1 Tax=Niabella ginsengisoli TaxID=522298 RepID=A0ABS9SMN1_9BACT|nr:acyl-CoA dehydrogenase family protein [Niabella ginsengisoli]MCH5599546.1 hypothetical protein [Niabella ginsengisoli]
MPLVLNNQRINRLRSLCADAEKKNALTPSLLEIIYTEKWFKLFLPKEYGGLELSLPDALKYEEELAYIDGSLGWTVTLCAGANLFAGYINYKKSRQMFSSKKYVWVEAALLAALQNK